MVFTPTTVAQLNTQVQNAISGTLDTDTYGQPDTWDISSITDWYSIDPLPFTLEQLKNIGMTPSQMKAVWLQLGQDIDGEAAYDYSGRSVSLSSDGTIMAIGANYNDGTNGTNSGHVRVYQFTDGSWIQLGGDIDGEAAYDYSGYSVSLSDDGKIVAIGAYSNDGTNGGDSGHVRVYQYSDGSWNQLGGDIDGEAVSDYSGTSVSLSNDGLTVAIGALYNDGTNGTDSGHVRVYQYNGTAWTQMGTDIDGEAAYDYSGYSVSLSDDGKIVAIGAYSNDGNETSSGHVRVYQYNGSAWNQMGGDIDGEAAYDQSGISVSLSNDGTIVAIGANYNDGTNGTNSGHVRVYQYDTDSTSWIQLGGDIDGEADNDYSGSSVSLSSDGSIVAIGARYNNGNGSDSGHVRVYQYNGTAWIQIGTDIDGEAANDFSGTSVSLSDNGYTVAIGAYGNDGNTGNVSDNRGHVRVFNVSNGYNLAQLKAVAFTLAELKAVGFTLAQLKAVGFDAAALKAAAFTLAELKAAAFTLAALKAAAFTLAELKAAEFDAAALKAADFTLAELKAAAFTLAELKAAFTLAELKAAFTLAELKAAFTLAELRATGFTAAELKAAAFTLAELKAAGFNLSEVINASFPFSQLFEAGYSIGVSQLEFMVQKIGQDIDGEAGGDYSGWSVSLSSDGKIVAIGARYNNGNGFDRGHVRVYQYNTDSTSWNQLGSDLDGEADDDYSGTSVSLNSDGSIVAIGANYNDGNTGNSDDNRGHVRVYKFNGSVWIQMGSDIDGEALGDYSGTSVSLSDNGYTVAIGASGNDSNGTDSGHVRVYQYSDGSWNQLGDDIDGEAADDDSGSSVSLSSDGSIVAIGAYDNIGINGNYTGHVRVYKYDTNTGSWNQMGQDIDGESASDFSGISVSLSDDGSIVAIGATGNDDNGTDSGHVRVYQYNGSAWIQMGTDIDGEAAYDSSGTSVSLSSDGLTVAIGADVNDGNGNGSGHVRVYQYDGTVWNQLGGDIDGEAAGDQSGISVSLSNDGLTVAIGANRSDGTGTYSGHVRVYKLDTLQLKTLGYTATDLATVGFNASQLKNLGYSSEQLNASIFDVAELLAAGYSLTNLIDNGILLSDLVKSFTLDQLKDKFTLAELKAAFTLAELKDKFTLAELKAEFKLTDLKAAGFILDELKAVGFILAELKAAGFILDELKDKFTLAELNKEFTISELNAEFTLTDLKNGGMNAAELHEVGYSFDQLRQVGFSAADCRNGGMSNIEIPTSRFSIKQLREGGLSSRRMRSAGYSAKQLYENGYAVPYLFQADYSASEIRIAGVNALQARFGGISNKEMKTAGYTVKEYKDAYYQASRMKKAGYTREELKGIYSEGELDAAGF